LDELERRLIAGLYDNGAATATASGPVARSRRERLRIAAVLAPGVLIAATVVLVFLVLGRNGGLTASQALERAANAASARSVPLLRPGEYWYTRTIETSLAPYPLISRSSLPAPGRAPQTVLVFSRQSMETWIGVDGSIRQRQVPLSVTFPTAAARQRWRASGSAYPTFGSNDSITTGGGRFPPQSSAIGGDIGDGLFTYGQLLTLPTTPSRLRAVLTRAQAALQHREQHGFSQTSPAPGTTSKTIALRSRPVADASSSQLLLTITSLLTSPVPAVVRAALYRLAATLPGAVYRGPVRDALGRAGIEIQIGHGPGGWRVIFDPATGELLQTSLAIAGTQYGPLRNTVAAQGITNSIYSPPAGISASPGRLPSPQAITITPSTGTPTTTFSMQLHLARRARHATIPVQFATVNGPTGENCNTYLVPPLTTELRHGKIIQTAAHDDLYRYPITPATTGRRAWCPGRYQLQLGAQDQTAAYFTVR
jgi:hypothetical protein